jgi:hypothetical protein
MFEQNKWEAWWDSLPQYTKEYLKSQPIWHDRDMTKALVFGIAIGFVVGVVVGFEWAWQPVVNTFRPLIG